METANFNLLTQEQAASRLGLKASTLEAWRFRGVGPSWIKLGGRLVRYRQSDLEAYLNQRVRSSTMPGAAAASAA